LPFSLRNSNGGGRNVAKGEFSAIKTVFPTALSTIYVYPYLVVRVQELPPQPWPTFIGDIPLWLTDKAEGGIPLDFGESPRLHSSLEFTVKGEIRDYHVPAPDTIWEVYNLVNGKGAGVDSIRFNGMRFLALGENEPAAGWRNVLPTRINGYKMGYIWGRSGKKEHAFRHNLPATTVKDDSDYRSQGEILRPGVLVEGLYKMEGQGHFTSLITTSGVCVEGPGGEKRITVSRYGFPLESHQEVYHPSAQPAPNFANKIGKVDKVFGVTDIALVKLEDGLSYAAETFSEHSEPGLPFNARPFRNLRDPKGLRYGDSVYMNTAVNGLCEGAHVDTDWKIVQGPGGQEAHMEIGTFLYWGNGQVGNLFEGCCGGVIWDESFDVIGQFHYVEKEADSHGRKLSYAPSFLPLIKEGYQLSSI